MRKILLAGASVLALGTAGAVADESGDIIQGGSGNAAYIEQLRDADGVSAFITQGTGAIDANAAISQEGDNSSNLARATINQNATGGAGNGNSAGITQDFGGGGGDVAAEINQLNSGNQAAIRQDASGTVDAIVDQGGGDGNTAFIRQGTNAPGLGQLNSGNGTLADVGRSYDFNDLNVAGFNGGVFNGDDLEGGFASATQTGNQNTGVILQSGISQDGTSVQFGDNNQSVIRQSNEGNIASVDQDGNLNESDVTQSGQFNDADVIQEGNENIASVEQTGDGNLAEVGQLGNFNRTEVTQDGDGDEALVNQGGSGLAILGGDPANNSFVTIDQSDDVVASFAVVDQAGDNNSAQINQ